jgi:uncharacterized protein Yka (UPF0111/DUF47 family)
MLRWLLPNEVSFFDYFIQQAAVVKDAADELSKEANLYRIKGFKDQGNEITHQCVDALRKTFITPIDRNDIFKLITRMNDIIDDIHVAARCYNIYKITERTNDFNNLSEVLLQCTQELDFAVKDLYNMKNIQDIQNRCLKINQLEDKADSLLAHSLGNLFEQEKDLRQLIKWKEIYELLEAATDRCQEAGFIIEGIILEHS